MIFLILHLDLESALGQSTFNSSIVFPQLHLVETQTFYQKITNSGKYHTLLIHLSY